MSSVQATKGKRGKVALSSFCPRFHRAVELIGRRWTGAVIRALCAGPRGFNELLATVPGLSDRLRITIGTAEQNNALLEALPG